MYYIYLLQSVKNKGLYIGCTNKLQKRIAQHNNGESYHTSKYRPWKLVYFESYINKEDAYSREHSLKNHGQALRRLKERLRNTLEM